MFDDFEFIAEFLDVSQDCETVILKIVSSTWNYMGLEATSPILKVPGSSPEPQEPQEPAE